MEDLRRAYLQRLRGTAEDLRNQPPGPVRDAPTIRERCHRLRGSAGAYGLHAVALAAGAVEDADDARLPDALRALVAAVDAVGG